MIFLNALHKRNIFLTTANYIFIHMLTAYKYVNVCTCEYHCVCGVCVCAKIQREIIIYIDRERGGQRKKIERERENYLSLLIG